MKRTTIGDVAAEARVSVATVSRVLNGGAVRHSTAARVREAASRLEYTPNALTKSIFAGRSSTIGVVIDDLRSPFYLDLMRGIDEVAGASGSLVMFASTSQHADREAAQVQAMDSQRVRGLIVTTGETTDDRTRKMAAGGTPCVIVARTALDPPAGLHSVALDNTAAGRLIAEHLISCGRRSAGVITSGTRPSQLAIGSFVLISAATILGASLAAGLILTFVSRDAAGSGIPQLKIAFWRDFGFFADEGGGRQVFCRSHYDWRRMQPGTGRSDRSYRGGFGVQYRWNARGCSTRASSGVIIGRSGGTSGGV